MGLRVVGRLAERHNVRVRLSSDEGVGVTVTVTLPPELVAATAPGSGLASAPSPPFEPFDTAVNGPSPFAPPPPTFAPLAPPPPPLPLAPAPTSSFAPPTFAPAPTSSFAPPPAAAPTPAPAPLVAAPAPRTPDPVPFTAALPTFAGLPTLSAPVLSEPASAPPEPASALSEPASALSEPASAPPEPASPPPDLLDDIRGGSEDEAETPIFRAMLSRWFIEDAAAAEMAGSPTPADASASASADPWHSDADAGWQAAEALNSASPHELTAAGLPKRQPQAFLVPGTAGGTSINGRPRSAEVARDRLSGFQRGVNRGRHEAAGAAGAAAPARDNDPDSDYDHVREAHR
jgi:hypothetical protein